mmetsp:Transcript_38816/g.92909  ORF Transcript_38816/g.92909 Transcript_38816/m.92909 type:complete len:211 (-) Transcript_38816:814-1446(-)
MLTRSSCEDLNTCRRQRTSWLRGWTWSNWSPGWFTGQENAWSTWWRWLLLWLRFRRIGDEQLRRSIIFIARLFMEENSKAIVRGIFRRITSLDKHSIIGCSASNPLLNKILEGVSCGEEKRTCSAAPTLRFNRCQDLALYIAPLSSPLSFRVDRILPSHVPICGRSARKRFDPSIAFTVGNRVSGSRPGTCHLMQIQCHRGVFLRDRCCR